MPWQQPSPRDYEGYSLEDDLPVKTYRLHDLNESDISDSDHQTPSLPDQEATVYTTRLPRRRFKLKFHSDAIQQPHAKVNEKWESQMTYVESDEKSKEMNNELNMLRKHQYNNDTNAILDDTPTTDSLHSAQTPVYPIPQPNGDVDENELNIPPYLSIWKKFGAPLKPQWNEIFKVLHNESNPYLMPIQAPNKIGQLLYKFNIDGYDVTTLLDLGASHSFITRTWASDKGLDLTPIRPPRPVGLFSGHKNYIRHVALVTKAKIQRSCPDMEILCYRFRTISRYTWC